MKKSEFIDRLTSDFKTVFPASLIEIDKNFTPNEIYVRAFLSHSSEDAPYNILENDPLHITFTVSGFPVTVKSTGKKSYIPQSLGMFEHLIDSDTDDTDMPDDTVLRVAYLASSITVKPKVEYLASSSEKIKVRAFTASADKTLTKLKSMWDLTHEMFEQLYQSNQILDDNRRIVQNFVLNGGMPTEDDITAKHQLQDRLHKSLSSISVYPDITEVEANYSKSASVSFDVTLYISAARGKDIKEVEQSVITKLQDDLDLNFVDKSEQGSTAKLHFQDKHEKKLKNFVT